jgi:hypothetical protein
MAGRLGAQLHLRTSEEPLRALFGETAGCLLVEVTAELQFEFEDLMSNYSIRLIGKVDSTQNLQITHAKYPILNVSVDLLLSAWKDRKIAGGQA